MFIGDVVNSGAIPSLELSLRFAGERQRIINHNVANLDTPDFRPRDISTRGFQQALDKAIRHRRESGGGMHGPMSFEGNREVQVGADGALRLMPRTGSGNILFHDRGNRDEIRLMQANAENAAMYRVTSELLRGRYQQIREAIAERV